VWVFCGIMGVEVKMDPKRILILLVVVFVALMVLATLAGEGTHRLQPPTKQPQIIQKRVSGTPPTSRITLPVELFCSTPVVTPIFGHSEGRTFVPLPWPTWSPPTWCPTPIPTMFERHALSYP